MTYVVNGSINEITSRLTRITNDQLKSMCKGFVAVDKQDQETCNLQLRLDRMPVNQSLSLIVQYTSKDIMLFDGVLQRVRGKISDSAAEKFIFELVNDNGISIFLKPKTKGVYKIIATIVSYSDIHTNNSVSLFPKNTAANKNSSNFVGETTQSGVTSLIISSTQVRRRQCNK
jgi:hypothetical protein